MHTSAGQIDLTRFVDAQNSGGVYAQALAELQSGRKVTHWMWFVFPQIAGLGRSATARHYAIASLDEAIAYLKHDVLGPRLVECSSIVAGQGRKSAATDIFGSVDALKLHSSMTLFMRADREQAVFADVLRIFFAGSPDAATEAILKKAETGSPQR